MKVLGSATVRPGRAFLALGCLMALGLAVSATPARAQVTVTGGLPEKCYWNKSTLQLPVEIEQGAGSIKEIRVYVKDAPTKPWEMLAKVPPTQKSIECKLPRDGEFWFTVATVDANGIVAPADLNAEPPAVIVVLDTCDPQLDIRPMPLCSDGTCMKCEVRDANPNPALTKFEYQDGNKNWRPANQNPGQVDCFCIPHVAVWTGMVRVSCSDRAKNTVTREFNFSDLALKEHGNDAVVSKNVAQVNYGPKDAAAVQVQQAVSQSVATVEKVTSVPPPAPARQPNPIAINSAMDIQPPQNPVCQTQACTKPLTGKCMLVNQPRISLDYRIEDEGKSGIGKVEVWITKDNGRTWDVLCDDPDKKSPVVCDLPGEGVYGIHLSVTNGRGFGATPPKAGEAPDYVVELDTTKPVAELRSVKLGPTDDCACIDIVWADSDKNLGNTPVDLYYSTSAQGTWTPIVKGAQNSGKYRWFPPQSIGKEAFVRMVVTDMAGNCTKCDAPEAVALDDGTRPRVTINGIGIVPTANVLAPIGN